MIEKTNIIETVKVIKVFDQYSDWSGKTSNSIVAFKLFEDPERPIGSIEFEQISGIDICLNSFEDIVVGDFDIMRNIITYMCDYKRRDPFFVDLYEGSSGCTRTTLYSNYSNIGVCTKKEKNKRAELYCSMYEKPYLEGMGKIWIGDLVELLRTTDPDFEKKLFNSFNSSKKMIRAKRKASYKYIKPIKPNSQLTFESLVNNNLEYVNNISQESKKFKVKDLYENNIHMNLLFTGKSKIVDGQFGYKPEKCAFIESDEFEPHLYKYTQPDNFESGGYILRLSKKKIFLFNPNKRLQRVSYKTFCKRYKPLIEEEVEVDYNNMHLNDDILLNEDKYTKEFIFFEKSYGELRFYIKSQSKDSGKISTYYVLYVYPDFKCKIFDGMYYELLDEIK